GGGGGGGGGGGARRVRSSRKGLLSCAWLKVLQSGVSHAVMPCACRAAPMVPRTGAGDAVGNAMNAMTAMPTSFIAASRGAGTSRHARRRDARAGRAVRQSPPTGLAGLTAESYGGILTVRRRACPRV